jgi:hypothetical protein
VGFVDVLVNETIPFDLIVKLNIAYGSAVAGLVSDESDFLQFVTIREKPARMRISL